MRPSPEEFESTEAWANDAFEGLPNVSVQPSLHEAILKKTTQRKNTWWQQPVVDWPSFARLAALAVMLLLAIPMIAFADLLVSWAMNAMPHLLASIKLIPGQLVADWFPTATDGLWLLWVITFFMGSLVLGIGGMVFHFTYSMRRRITA